MILKSGELGYEKFGDMYKVWKRTSRETPNTYYLIGFVRKVNDSLLGPHWEAWNIVHNRLTGRRDSMVKAAEVLYMDDQDKISEELRSRGILN